MEDKHSLHYGPLPSDEASFRLLRVLPSLKINAPLRCELIAGPIRQFAGKYAAGSYVWGASEHNSHILVNGINVQVRENLADFLRGFRGRATTLTIWIDAICVNQNDPEERGSQVRLMSQIYSNATATYCWLGSHPKVVNALKTVERFNLPGSDFTDGSTSFKMGNKEYHPLVAIEGACMTIMDCEYWFRSWIVPEFVLASQIHLLAGRTSISGYYHNFMDKILRGLDNDFKINVQSKVNIKSLAHLRRLHTMHESYHRGIRFNLEMLFGSFINTGCAIPRDRLFSLMGLLTPEAATLLEPTVSYNVNAWDILRYVLESGLILDYPRFTNLFSDKVLQGEQTPLSMAPIKFPFLLSLHVPEHSTLECPDHKLGPQSDTVISCWWLDYLARPYEVVTLSSQAVPGKHANGRKLYTCGLVAPCDERCVKRCSGHTLAGVAFLWEASLYNRELRTSKRVAKFAWAHTLDSGTADFEKHSDFHLNILEPKTLSERLRPYSDSVVMTREGSTNYSMAANLETFVRLCQFVMELDSAFETIPNCAFRP